MKARVAAQAVATKTEVGQLKRAIDTEDFDRVAGMMTASPDLHRAPHNPQQLSWAPRAGTPPSTLARLE